MLSFLALGRLAVRCVSWAASTTKGMKKIPLQTAACQIPQICQLPDRVQGVGIAFDSSFRPFQAGPAPHRPWRCAALIASHSSRGGQPASVHAEISDTRHRLLAPIWSAAGRRPAASSRQRLATDRLRSLERPRMSTNKGAGSMITGLWRLSAVASIGPTVLGGVSVRMAPPLCSLPVSRARGFSLALGLPQFRDGAGKFTPRQSLITCDSRSFPHTQGRGRNHSARADGCGLAASSCQ